MSRTHLSNLEHVQNPEIQSQYSELQRIAASTSALLVGAGAIAVAVPVVILSLLIYFLEL